MNVQYIFTKRDGGFSKNEYSSLNLSFSVGDDRENVIRNRKVIKQKIKIDDLVWLHSSSSNKVKILQDKINCAITDCSAIVTNKKDIALMAFTSDEIVLLLYDKESFIAIINLSLDNSYTDIISSTLKLARDEFGANEENINAIFGPSLKPCCFDIYDEKKIKIYKNYVSSHFLDLPKYNKDILLQNNIKEQNIKFHPACTSCDKNYFSQKNEDKGKSAGLIWIKGGKNET